MRASMRSEHKVMPVGGGIEGLPGGSPPNPTSTQKELANNTRSNAQMLESCCWDLCVKRRDQKGKVRICANKACPTPKSTPLEDPKVIKQSQRKFLVLLRSPTLTRCARAASSRTTAARTARSRCVLPPIHAMQPTTPRLTRSRAGVEDAQEVLREDEGRAPGRLPRRAAGVVTGGASLTVGRELFRATRLLVCETKPPPLCLFT